MSSHFGDYQIGIYMQGMAGMRPTLPLLLEELEAQAREKLDPKAYWYVAGGAGSGDTVTANRRTFDQWKIVPRMLTDVSDRNYATTVGGTALPAPVMLAPIGVQEIVHPEAELAVAQAAHATGIPMMLSTLSSNPLEKVAETLGDTPRWFQLYWPGDAAVTKSLIARAEAAGYEGIAVTLDTRLMGWRPHDLEEAYLPFLEGKGIANYTSDPAFRNALDTPPEDDPRAAIAHWAEVYSDPGQTWDDLKLIRDATELPVYVKGILHPDDARQALAVGMDGVIVSNHGGRQVGGSLAAPDAHPAAAEAVGGKGAVLFDSGIRHGADLVKALALGADAVLLGRPYVWGLAVDGDRGAAEVIRRFLADFDLTMALSGFASLNALDRSVLTKSE